MALRWSCLDGLGRPAPMRRAGFLALALAANLLAFSAQAWAGSARVSGAEMNGFGRAVFTFDEMPRTTAKITNGVLVVTFDRAVSVNLDKLPMELSSYVSAVRMDPDNKGFRLGLMRPMRANTMDAGEQLFLDLLPEAWKGPPPALPASVVEDLSRRLREAEETARRLTRKAAAEIRPEIVFRVGTTSALSRIVFETPEIVPVSLQRGDNSAELTFDAALRLDGPALKAALPEWVTSVQVTPGAETLKLSLGLAPGVQVNGFREDEAYAIDIVPVRSAAEPAKSARAPDPTGLDRLAMARLADSASAESKKVADAKTPEAKVTDGKVADAKLAETKPPEAKLAEVKASDGKAPETKPVDAKTVDVKPVPPKPAEAKAAEAKPTEAKIVKARPTDVKRTEIKPTNIKPSETGTAETRPSAASPRVPEIQREQTVASRAEASATPQGQSTQARSTSSPTSAAAQLTPPMPVDPQVQSLPPAPVSNSIQVRVSSRDADTTRIALSLPASTPLAVFERAGVVWIAARVAAAL